MLEPNFDPFIDSWGLLVQRLDCGGDGGDSAHRFGSYIFAKAMLVHDKMDVINKEIYVHEYSSYYRRALNLYMPENQLPRRHPDPSRWYSRPDNFSRDQTRMLLAAAYAMEDVTTSKRIMGNLAKRLGWHNNVRPNWVKPGQDGWKWKIPDNVIPSQIAMYIRTTKNKLLYPLLVVLDAFLLVDLALTAYADAKDKRTDGSRTDAHTMLLCDIVAGSRTLVTPCSWLASKIYRRMDYPGALRYIFDQRRSWDPPLAEPLILAVKKTLD